MATIKNNSQTKLITLSKYDNVECPFCKKLYERDSFKIHLFKSHSRRANKIVSLFLWFYDE